MTPSSHPIATPAETEARRLAGSLAWSARLPRADATAISIATTARVIIDYAEQKAATPPRPGMTFEQQLNAAAAAGLSGRPAPDFGVPFDPDHAANVWAQAAREISLLPIAGAA